MKLVQNLDKTKRVQSSVMLHKLFSPLAMQNWLSGRTGKLVEIGFGLNNNHLKTTH